MPAYPYLIGRSTLATHGTYLVPDPYIHMACLSWIGQGSALNLKVSERGISPSLFP